ncbi:hypothetical protein GX420_07750 [bacterium]|nr:hypothetical protein [bacterium]
MILGLIGVFGLKGYNNIVVSENENELYKKNAIEFIKNQEEIIFQLKGSIPTSPFVYKDKYGNDRTIVFGVEKESKIIGRIVINYDKNNPIFLEFAENPPHHLIDVEKEAASKISLKENQYLKNEEFIYIFPLLFFIHFDVIEEDKKVDDLYFFWNEKKIVSINDMGTSCMYGIPPSNEINNDRPLAILINWNIYTWHWITGISYYQGTARYYIYVRDGYGNEIVVINFYAPELGGSYINIDYFGYIYPTY